MEPPPLFPMDVSVQTTDDYWTPSWIFEAMGIRFDLDVCAPPGGIPWIPADRYFTKADDGLAQPWEGRVWMNPPFSAPRPWVDRFLGHRNGVALVPIPKSGWFESVWNDVDAAIAMDGTRLSKFYRSNKCTDILLPCCLVAFGPECVEAIGRVGKVR